MLCGEVVRGGVGWGEAKRELLSTLLSSLSRFTETFR